MPDDTDVVESLRALAARLYPPHPEPDHDDREAVRALWGRLDRAVETVGEMAGWDPVLLRRATGGLAVDDEDDEPPWHVCIVGAAMRAERRAEPLDVSARRLADSALLAVKVAGLPTAASWSDWVETLAGHNSQDPRAALAMARDEVPFAALRHGAPLRLIADAQRLLDEALGRLS